MIHKTAIIGKKAEIDSSVVIGPYSIIDDDVRINAETIIESHVVIKNNTTIGKHNHIFQFASIGEVPQDLKFKGEESTLVIGDNNIFREYCTINRGTGAGISETLIGSDNLFMAYSHVAHDCIIKNNCIFSVVEPTLIKNTSQLANVDGVLNGIKIQTDHLSSLFLEGQGAGGKATASSIISDLFEIINKSQSINDLKEQLLKQTHVEYVDELGDNLWALFNTLTEWSTHAKFKNEKNKASTVISRENKIRKVLPMLEDIRLAA